MINKSQWNALKCAYGLETATLLLHQPMSISEIQSRMIYDVKRTQIRRIIDSLWKEDLLDLKGERGEDIFTIKMEHFTDSELKRVNELAIARIQNAGKARGGSRRRDEIPPSYFNRIDRSHKLPVQHLDSVSGHSHFPPVDKQVSHSD